MFKPRFYQEESHAKAIEYMRQYSHPCLISLPMGAGKSLTVAMLAESLHKQSGGKRVLCLAPSKELIEQNFAKFTAMGGKASIYSASISKSMRHAVVFATEQSFLKIAKKFAHEFCAIIADECHKVTNTLLQIYGILKEANPMLRMCGLTATPHAMGKGYIYEIDEKNRLVKDAKKPFYKKMVYSISAETLIEHGYLTPPKIGKVDEHYDTQGLELKNGKFNEKQLAEKFEGSSVTASITQDILLKTQDRKRCLIFATSIKHAEEVQALIPDCGLVSGKTAKAERESILKSFADGKIKYLVNVAILTTGYDLPILDAIAILRPTESAGLYQQIIGRGTRLAEGKEDFLVLDYTDNIPQFFSGKDSIFEPNIKSYGSEQSKPIQFSCPDCGTENESSPRKKKKEGQGEKDEFYEFDPNGGYALDLAGERIELQPNVYMPAHYARRCCGVVLKGRNQYERCSFYWAHKDCPACQEKCDIAAKNCQSCGFALIRPDEKLHDTAYVLNVGDTFTTDVVSMNIKKSTSGERVVVEFVTAHGKNIASAFYPTTTNYPIRAYWSRFKKLTNDGTLTPKQIRYTVTKKGCTINEYIMQ